MNEMIFSPPDNNPVNGAVIEVTNHSGLLAYSSSDPRVLLAQYAIRGTFSDRAYATAEVDFNRLNTLILKCPIEYVAKVAVFAKKYGHMRDVPTYLLGVISKHDPDDLYTSQVAKNILNGPSSVRRFFKMIRSGVFGTRSLGSRFQRLINSEINRWDSSTLFNGFVGKNPRLIEVIDMAHTRFSASSSKCAVYKWKKGILRDGDHVPFFLKNYLEWKQTPGDIRDSKEMSLPTMVSFEYLLGEELTKREWRLLALRCTYTQLRQSLAMFVKNGVFEDADTSEQVATRLRDLTAIRNSNTLPYQLYAAYINNIDNLPQVVKDALNEALLLMIDNVPLIKGSTIVALDVSSSMISPVVTAGKVASQITNIEVAALLCSVLARRCEKIRFIIFNNYVNEIGNAKNFITEFPLLLLPKYLRNFAGGGTNISLAMRWIHAAIEEGPDTIDNIIVVSDNECNSGKTVNTSQKTWKKIKSISPSAKLAMVDIDVSDSRQIIEDESVTTVCGFTNRSFLEIAEFFCEDGNKISIVDRVEQAWNAAPLE